MKTLHRPRTLHAGVIAAILLCLPLVSFSTWLPTDGGTYSYNDPSNWDGGTISGNFSAALTGAQTITFNANTNLVTTSNSLNFSYATLQDMTLQSDDPNVTRTLFVGTASNQNIISMAAASTSSTRTITLADSLIIDLSGGTGIQHIRSANGTTFYIDAKITGGGATGLQFWTGSSSAVNDIYLRNDTSDFTADLRTNMVRSLRYTSIADIGVASAVGAGSDIRLSHTSSSMFFDYIGAGSASTNRTVWLEATSTAATMTLSNNSEDGGTLTFTGDFKRANSTASSVVRFSGDSDIVVSGIIEHAPGTNTLSFVKLGTNTVTLSGTNEYSGTTGVTNGVLLVNGSIGSGAVTVESGSTLGGTGTIGGATTIQGGGVLSPGNSAGTLTFGSTLTLNQNAEIRFEFLDNTTAGTTYDQIVGSSLVLPETGNITLRIVGLTDHEISLNDQFTLFTGTVSNFDASRITILNESDWAGEWQVSEGSLLLTAIPEPSSLGLILGALGLFGLRRRTWRRTS